MRIKDITTNERPREKALTYGINSLSNIELLAIIISSGTKEKNALQLAYELIYFHHGLANLALMEHPNQIKVKGIGNAKALKVLASLTLARRLQQTLPTESIKFDHPRIVYEHYASEFHARKRENLLLIMLDASHQRISEKWIYEGTSKGFSLELKDIFQPILISGASGFIMVHNHPSNIASPSNSDILSTKQIRDQAKKLDLTFVDHVIITKETYYSFALNKWPKAP